MSGRGLEVGEISALSRNSLPLRRGLRAAPVRFIWLQTNSSGLSLGANPGGRSGLRASRSSGRNPACPGHVYLLALVRAEIDCRSIHQVLFWIVDIA